MNSPSPTDVGAGALGEFFGDFTLDEPRRIVGLSAIEADVQRNLQLLKERAWLDIPLVYKNGRRAILSIEKGVPGDKVFEDAFTAWGQ
jgi:hypothetical protein